MHRGQRNNFNNRFYQPQYQPQYEEQYEEEEEEEEQLEFHILDEDHQFRQEDILNFAQMVGIDARKEQNLLYLAREGKEYLFE
jgi:hypothetical protein